jgi:hypothetical protein
MYGFETTSNLEEETYMKYLIILLLCLAVPSNRAIASPPDLDDSSVAKLIE